MSGYLKDDANSLTYSITSDVKKIKKQQQQKQQQTNKETSKIKQQIRHDSTLEKKNTLQRQMKIKMDNE